MEFNEILAYQLDGCMLPMGTQLLLLARRSFQMKGGLLISDNCEMKGGHGRIPEGSGWMLMISRPLEKKRCGMMSGKQT